MSKDYGLIIGLATAVAVLAFIVGGVVGSCVAERKAPVIKVDTVRVVDTIRETKPVVVRSYTRDTIRVACVDTLRVCDTLYLQLPREVREYKNDDYRAVVSGYRPSLDSIDIYRHTEYINSVEYIKAPVKRWGVGIQVGGGAVVCNKQVKLAPYVGVGISYNIVVW